MLEKIRLKILRNPTYRGKHMIFVAGKIFTAKDGREAKKILDRIEKKFPRKRVTLTYIPKADTLILFL